MMQDIVRRWMVVLAFTSFLVIVIPGDSFAYIGPGAGFAFVSSFFIIFITIVLTLFTLLFLPLRLIIRSFRRKRTINTEYGINRVVIIGLDGLDPELAGRFMDEGKLPNLAGIAKEGSFKELGTTLPAMSPVAWSSFITGVDPSRHNIFDFLNRDLKTYMPVLSSTRIETPSRFINIGKYSIPLEKAKIKGLRRGKPFWHVLAEHGIFSSVIRVPMTFPPERFNGVLLSGMCVPDLKGTQGTFTFYTSARGDKEKRTGGVIIPVSVDGDRVNTYISGPESPGSMDGGELKIPLEIRFLDTDRAELRIDKERILLKVGEYSDWIRVRFRAGLNRKITGICRFFIKQITPSFEMYMTPINIDPEKPAMPISHPFYYAYYLAKMIGSYATLGLAEDTWALNEGVIDEDMFLEQAYRHHKEREEMFFNALERTRSGACICVFDTTDRIQHMFMRFVSNGHPADSGDDSKKDRYAGIIEELYTRMDAFVGRVKERLNKDDLLIVISDHGFKPFKRGVNLNTWLYKNGYLHLKDGKDTGGEWFKDVDWAKTRAYTFGLTGIYINQKGREAQGIVTEEEKEDLKKELMERLKGLKDEETGRVAIKKVFDIDEYFDGPYRENGPDLIIGYGNGYRASWGAAVGKVDECVFEDNSKPWSGDHCIEPSLVPGIIFSNREIKADAPHIMDIAPTVLKVFGINIPSYMKGKPLI